MIVKDGGRESFYDRESTLHHGCELCSRGGLDLTEMIREMAAERQTRLRRTRLCHGRQRVSHTASRVCLNVFEVLILVEYASEAP